MNPKPFEIRAARTDAKLSQPKAAALVYVSLRTWQNWESGVVPMHPGLWELFEIKVFANS